MEKEFADTVYERFLKEFIDILMMVKIREAEATGYDLLVYFHKKFDLLVSPGTVYSVLYSMERNGFVKARMEDKRRIYSLTPKGKTTIKAINESYDALENFFSCLLRRKLTKAEHAPCDNDFSPLVDMTNNSIRE